MPADRWASVRPGYKGPNGASRRFRFGREQQALGTEVPMADRENHSMRSCPDLLSRSSSCHLEAVLDAHVLSTQNRNDAASRLLSTRTGVCKGSNAIRV